ncbi:MAG: site-specific integrase [Planctomycetes bacterium]|nr:site-specific integrase [Planctomycetota bacterium]
MRFRASIPGGRRGSKQWTPLFETADEAAEMRRRVLEKLDELPARAMTFDEAIDATRADFEQRCRPGTVRWFDSQKAALRDFFGRMLVSAISPQDIERFAAKITASGVSVGTVLNRKRALRCVLSHVREQLTKGDPMQKVRKGTWPKQREAKVTAPEPETILEVLRKTRESGTSRAEQDHDIVAVLFLMGLRKSELGRMQAEHLDPEKGTVWVEGKTKNENLPVSGEAMEVLQRMAGRVGGSGALVPGGADEITRVFRRAAKHGDKLTPHAMRRAFVTTLIRAGHDIATVARYSRHTTDEIKRYMAANEDDKRVLAAVSIKPKRKPRKKAASTSAPRQRKVE